MPTPSDTGLTLQLTDVNNQTTSINIDTFRFGFHNATTIGSSGGTGAGTPTFDALDVSIALGNASPGLFAALTMGTQYTTATLTQKDANGKALAVWTLGHAFLTSDTISGDGLDTPEEELKFVFKSITEATASGMSGVPAASASWDQVTNTASGPPLTTAPDPAAQYPADPAATAVLTLSNATGGTSVTLPIDSYQFGFHNTPSFGSGGTTSKATFDALDVTLPLSNGSPALLTALTSAAHYQQATLTLKDFPAR